MNSARPEKAIIPNFRSGIFSLTASGNWISLINWKNEKQDLRAKKAYDITTNRATLSTIHSAKGLDYSVVFLLGLDYLAPKAEGWTAEQIDHLIFGGFGKRWKHSQP